MKKFLLSVATVAMFANFANAEVITLDVKNASDFKGTDVAEVKPEGDKNGSARHIQPLNSLVMGDFDFSFSKGSGSTDPAYYFANSWNANSASSLRLYKNNTMTISAPSDLPIGKIVGVDEGKKNYVIYSGDFVNEYVYTNTTGSTLKFVSFEITVNEKGEAPVLGKGDTKENPYSVAEALQYIEDKGSEGVVKYVIGYITSISQISEKYGDAEFVIADNHNDTEGLTVYRCKYLNGEKFTSADQIKVGMHVIVNGNLVLYKDKNLKEISNGELVSIDASGVENIVAVADEAPVYYNMQGVRVANPENGVFIEVKGNKAAKVVL